MIPKKLRPRVQAKSAWGTGAHSREVTMICQALPRQRKKAWRSRLRAHTSAGKAQSVNARSVAPSGEWRA